MFKPTRKFFVFALAALALTQSAYAKQDPNGRVVRDQVFTAEGNTRLTLYVKPDGTYRLIMWQPGPFSNGTWVNGWNVMTTVDKKAPPPTMEDLKKQIAIDNSNTGFFQGGQGTINMRATLLNSITKSGKSDAFFTDGRAEARAVQSFQTVKSRSAQAAADVKTAQTRFDAATKNYNQNCSPATTDDMDAEEVSDAQNKCASLKKELDAAKAGLASSQATASTAGSLNTNEQQRVYNAEPALARDLADHEVLDPSKMHCCGIDMADSGFCSAANGKNNGTIAVYDLSSYESSSGKVCGGSDYFCAATNVKCRYDGNGFQATYYQSFACTGKATCGNTGACASQGKVRKGNPDGQSLLDQLGISPSSISTDGATEGALKSRAGN
jgi:hypothetical protein